MSIGCSAKVKFINLMQKASSDISVIIVLVILTSFMPKNSQEFKSADLFDIESVEKLDRLVVQSSRVILDIRTVFPFNFFPDDLIVDETKVSIHTNFFFYSKEVRSIDFKDIFNVVVQQGVFFATLEIVDRYFSHQVIKVKFLKKKEAIVARKIIQGMIIAKKEGIETHSIPMGELIKKLSKIGRTR